MINIISCKNLGNLLVYLMFCKMYCISDKSRVVVMDKSKGEPVISVKRGSKESGDKNKTSTSKEKVSTVSKNKPKESTEGGKDKTKESKKDILSFDQIRVRIHIFMQHFGIEKNTASISLWN